MRFSHVALITKTLDTRTRDTTVKITFCRPLQRVCSIKKDLTPRHNFHETSKPIVWESYKYFKMPLAEIFTPHAKRYNKGVTFTCSILGIEPRDQKTLLRTCAPSEDSDLPAHSRSLIRIFPGCILDSQGCKVFTYR